MSKYNIDTARSISLRAENSGLLRDDKTSLMMDLECVTRTFCLDLEGLLAADDFNFLHDVTGIQMNLNRKTLLLENNFIPRHTTFNMNTKEES